MDIEEVRKLKEEAEKQIAEIISSFEEKTGVVVDEDIRHRWSEVKLESGLVFKKEHYVYLTVNV